MNNLGTGVGGFILSTGGVGLAAQTSAKDEVRRLGHQPGGHPRHRRRHARHRQAERRSRRPDERGAEAHRIPVEVKKTGKEKGRYLHPKEHGEPDSKGIAQLHEKRIERPTR